jgi:hypothetical protein
MKMLVMLALLAWPGPSIADPAPTRPSLADPDSFPRQVAPASLTKEAPPAPAPVVLPDVEAPPPDLDLSPEGKAYLESLAKMLLPSPSPAPAGPAPQVALAPKHHKHRDGTACTCDPPGSCGDEDCAMGRPCSCGGSAKADDAGPGIPLYAVTLDGRDVFFSGVPWAQLAELARNPHCEGAIATGKAGDDKVYRLQAGHWVVVAHGGEAPDPTPPVPPKTPPAPVPTAAVLGWYEVSDPRGDLMWGTPDGHGMIVPPPGEFAQFRRRVPVAAPRPTATFAAPSSCASGSCGASSSAPRGLGLFRRRN